MRAGSAIGADFSLVGESVEVRENRGKEGHCTKRRVEREHRNRVDRTHHRKLAVSDLFPDLF